MSVGFVGGTLAYGSSSPWSLVIFINAVYSLGSYQGGFSSWGFLRVLRLFMASTRSTAKSTTVASLPATSGKADLPPLMDSSAFQVREDVSVQVEDHSEEAACVSLHSEMDNILPCSNRSMIRQSARFFASHIAKAGQTYTRPLSPATDGEVEGVVVADSTKKTRKTKKLAADSTADAAEVEFSFSDRSLLEKYGLLPASAKKESPGVALTRLRTVACRELNALQESQNDFVRECRDRWDKQDEKLAEQCQDIDAVMGRLAVQEKASAPVETSHLFLELRQSHGELQKVVAVSQKDIHQLNANTNRVAAEVDAAAAAPVRAPLPPRLDTIRMMPPIEPRFNVGWKRSAAEDVTFGQNKYARLDLPAIVTAIPGDANTPWPECMPVRNGRSGIVIGVVSTSGVPGVIYSALVRQMPGLRRPVIATSIGRLQDPRFLRVEFSGGDDSLYFQRNWRAGLDSRLVHLAARSIEVEISNPLNDFDVINGQGSGGRR